MSLDCCTGYCNLAKLKLSSLLCSLCNNIYREPEDSRAEEGGFTGKGGHVGKVLDDQSDGPLWSEGDLQPLPLVLLQLLDRKLYVEGKKNFF